MVDFSSPSHTDAGKKGRMSGSIIEAESCLNLRKVDIRSRRYRELPLRKNNMTVRFHFNKKYETR